MKIVKARPVRKHAEIWNGHNVNTQSFQGPECFIAGGPPPVFDRPILRHTAEHQVGMWVKFESVGYLFQRRKFQRPCASVVQMVQRNSHSVVRKGGLAAEPMIN